MDIHDSAPVNTDTARLPHLVATVNFLLLLINMLHNK